MKGGKSLCSVQIEWICWQNSWEGFDLFQDDKKFDETFANQEWCTYICRITNLKYFVLVLLSV